jgi:pimeloyl-ACP methyl ester carboxylesterase
MNTSEKKDLQADVVVIGSGGGLSAAVIAAENGASVILLEKENILGGYTRQANALFAVESPLQRRKDVNVTTDDLFRRVMAWNHWYRVDAGVVRAYINQSGKSIEWLENRGVKFDLITNHAGLPIIHMPEDMMAADPDTFWMRKCARQTGDTSVFGEALEEYLTAFRDPETIRGSCEDYRAAATIDIAHDNAETGKLPMPLLCLWGSEGTVEKCFDPLAEWLKRAQSVEGRALPCGHYMPEEIPEQITAELAKFFVGDLQ